MRVTRRGIIQASGAALAAAAGIQQTAQAAPQTKAQALSSGPRKDRAFLSDEPIRKVTRSGRKGIELKVRLTSYRSLPLSCIEGIRLKVDGQDTDPKEMILTLNGYSHKLDKLGQLSQAWWFILDYADLFVPWERDLAPGEHAVEGTLITVEPYMTAGRFSFYSTSTKRLALETDAGAKS